MKRFLLSTILSVAMLPALLFAQNPCRPISDNYSGGASGNINQFITQFNTGSFDILDEIDECFNVQGQGNRPNQENPTLTLIARTSSQGPLLNIVVYEDLSPNAVDGATLFPNQAFSFEFEIDQQYGVTVDFLGTGTFTAIVDGVNPGLDGTYELSVTSAAPVTWAKNLSYTGFGENIQFNWSVTEQVDVARYELEKLDQTLGFKAIAEVPYKENGSLQVDYSVVSPWPQSGAYYRIKQWDHAGTYDYSNVVFVEGNDAAVQQFKMFPNPASDFVRMSIPEGINSVDLISASGQVVRSYTANEARREGLDVSSVSAGMYFVRPVGGNGATKPQRLVVNH